MTDSTKELPAVVKRKPPAAGMGRPKGIPNKTTRALKEAILIAARRAGGTEDDNDEGLVNYLHDLAEKQPVAFSGLLGKVLPMTIAGDAANPLNVVAEVKWSVIDPKS